MKELSGKLKQELATVFRAGGRSNGCRMTNEIPLSTVTSLHGAIDETIESQQTGLRLHFCAGAIS